MAFMEEASDPVLRLGDVLCSTKGNTQGIIHLTRDHTFFQGSSCPKGLNIRFQPIKMLVFNPFPNDKF